MIEKPDNYIVKKTVGIECLREDSITYPENAPFRPSIIYPEFQNKIKIGSEPNHIFELTRNLFIRLGMDPNRTGLANWNPLGAIVSAGNRVLVKPNLVRHIHLGGGDYRAVVTHGSIVRCVLDYVCLALEGRGEIIVGDAPVQSAEFSEIVRKTRLDEVCKDVSESWGIPVRLVDFRLWAVKRDEDGRLHGGKKLGGDPSGYIAVDLGKQSLLAPMAGHCRRFRVTSYGTEEMARHHNQETNEYIIPKAILDADVFINLPKMKTHRKVGLTAALKNTVGINGHKDWLPHHREGALCEGGDEYRHPSLLKSIQTWLQEKIDMSASLRGTGSIRLASRLVNRLVRQFSRDPYLEGSWYGNDTLWRTVLDLNRLILYADREGKLGEEVQRRYFTIIDAVIAGEGEGPMEPDPKHCGILVGGMNAVAVDAVLATIAGFDYRKIPLIKNGFGRWAWPLVDFSPADIDVRSNASRWNGIKIGERCDSFRFRPPYGWKNHIEYD